MTTRPRWKRLWRLLLVLLSSAALGALLYVLLVEAPYTPSGFATPNEVSDLPRIVAHKAISGAAPGNTLAGVQRLLETDIGALEIDVRLSRDGVPVVLHEEKLDGVTTGRGLVGERTADELSRMRLRVDGAETTHGVPRLDDVLGLVGRSKVVFLDAKDAGVRDSGMPGALAALIRKHDVHPTVIVESFNPVFLWRMRKADPRVRIMFDFADDTTPTAEESPAQLAQIPWLLKQEPFRRGVRRLVRPDLLGPRFSVAPERLRALADYGYPLVAWTVDDPEQAARLLQAGVSAVMTNEPLGMSEALRNRVERSIDDASRLDLTAVAQLVEVRSEDDVRRALLAARAAGRKVSIAGRRHSMGGQSLGPGHVVLDMTRLRGMALESASEILTVGAGASWSDVQRFLDPRGRAVLVMQSDNVFSVGGTLSVNAHGWQPRRPPVASTVKSFRLMLASGEVKTCSREENAELFHAALGGYGLIGVILDARLETTPNVLYRKHSSFFAAAEYPRRFRERVAGNAAAGLAYGRLSVDGGHLLTQAALYVYERVASPSSRLPPMSDEGMIDLKREIFRASERSDAGKRRRWLLETNVGPLLKAPSTRNTVMNSDIHFLWPTDLSRRDILHEYFVPPPRFDDFLVALREALRQHGQELLNVTVRDLRKDQDSLLAYAREDVFAFVLLFSQRPSPAAEASMQAFTRDLVERTLALGGTFYLPYRLHYTPEQFLRGYPMAREFLELKRSVDPEELFSSRFYEHIRTVASERPAQEPVQRSDENSRLAHEELLQKAKQGRIDVYFEGDSITRRWGTSDEQYKELLANWTRNFFGWNAANFGWGADTIQNVLWRLDNGELDGVNPKVIVVMAGTNDVAKPLLRGAKDARVADISRGIQAMLDVCRRKAAAATIVLMGITPRNDDMALMPIINDVDREIAKLADGKKVRFVNINGGLADRDGKLLPGMTGPDKLHLAVKGYQVWADALEPILTELLGPPGKEDHAPPATGDPSARRRR